MWEGIHPVRPWNENVPTFDGRKAFKVSLYHSLPLHQSELPTNSAVMVIFTISSYTTTSIMHHEGYENVNLNISLNIQAVVLLANPDSTMDDIVPEPAEPLGMLPDSDDDSSHTADSTSEEEEAI